MKKESMISNWSRRVASKILGRNQQNLLQDSVPFLEMSEEKGCNLEILLRKQIFYLQGRGNPIRIFSKEDLKKGTNNFRTHHWLNEGKFLFYEGTLDNRKVVVRVAPQEASFIPSVEEVIVEAVLLSSMSHKNVEKFLGCCLETKYPILVYEFIPNCRTLEDCISDQMLPWSDRYRIATEVAEAVNYLHIHSSIAIVHRDIKTNNILLDEHQTAKISGFHYLFPMPPGKKTAEDVVVGNYYYVDPEYMRTGDLNEKSDVYGYGVVLLRLLTGRSLVLKYNFSLVKEFFPHIVEGRVADILEYWVVTEGRMDQIQAVAEVALECVRDKREERPSMKQVVEKLWAIRKML